jgi:SAM-dependent methyltransferase
VKLNPEELTTLDAYEQHGDVWAQTRGNAVYYPEQIDRMRELIPQGKILDIGSGTGRDAELLTQQGYDCVGVDISDKLLAIARARLPQVPFVKQSLYELDFPYKFDGFWAAAVLVHVPKHRMPEALDSISSVLKKEAAGFVTVKDVYDGVEDEIEEYEVSPGHVMKRFYSYWRKNEFEQQLQTSNFKVVDYYRPVADTRMWHCYFVRKKI